MIWNTLSDARKKSKLRKMLSDPRATRGYRSIGQLEQAIAADRLTTERLLVAVGATKSASAEEWTLSPSARE